MIGAITPGKGPECKEEGRAAHGAHGFGIFLTSPLTTPTKAMVSNTGSVIFLFAVHDAMGHVEG